MLKVISKIWATLTGTCDHDFDKWGDPYTFGLIHKFQARFCKKCGLRQERSCGHPSNKDF